MIKAGSMILFQGDSITDTKRDRDVAQANYSHALGVGYCNHVAAYMLRQRPADNLQFYNRGISGNRIVDLYARWRVDAINLKPDVISILVGVNDTWHAFKAQNGVEPERYAMVYRMLLDYTRQQLPDVQFVLCEPFVLQCGEVTEAWIGEMGQRQQIVRRLADEFGAQFVPFQSALNEVLELAPAEYWLADGVHPTPAGHRVLAECWIETVTGTKIGL
jgi:lysophospholipase L1-like esterase